MNKARPLSFFIAAAAMTTAITIVLALLPGSFTTVNSQTRTSDWSSMNYQSSLNGDRLTYYRGTTPESCQADCDRNPNCKGFTLIRAGAYSPNDPPMCYLLSRVTSSTPANCCISAVKGAGGSIGWGTINNQATINGRNLTYYGGTTPEQCQADCSRNPNCKAFTFIRAGAYNPRDRQMCYLIAEVSAVVQSSCCISGVKTTSDTGGSSCPTDYTIQAPSSAAAGSRIKIRYGFRGARPTSQTDWIALFKVGTNSWVEWYWVKDLGTGCEASFAAPSPGNYEFRYLLEGGYDKVTARAPIVIQ